MNEMATVPKLGLENGQKFMGKGVAAVDLGVKGGFYRVSTKEWTPLTKLPVLRLFPSNF